MFNSIIKFFDNEEDDWYHDHTYSGGGLMMHIQEPIPSILNQKFYSACKRNNIELVKSLINEDTINHSLGFYSATRSLGYKNNINIEIFKLLIKYNGFYRYYQIIYNLCYLELSILKKIDYFNWICYSKEQEDLIIFAIEKGNSWDYHNDYFENINNLKIYKLYLQKGGKINKIHYNNLIIKYCPLYTIIKYKEKSKVLKKIPNDLLIYMNEFLN